MKKLRFFDSLKFMRFVVAAIVCTFILNVAHADTTINSVIAYGKTEQSGTPTPTNPVPIMTNNGVLKYRFGKNLFDVSAYDTASDWTGTNYRYIEIPLPNGTYTLSWDKSKGTGSGIYWLLQVDGTKKGTSAPGTGGSWIWHNDVANIQKDTVTFTVTEGYVYLSCSFTGKFNAFLAALRTVQIERGSTATAYVPYSGPNGIYVDGMVETIRDSAGHTATAQMLLGLNDTYRDEQNITTGAITRKVGVKVLDGTENWFLTDSYLSGMFNLKISDLFAQTSTTLTGRISPYCTHFKSSTNWISAGARNGYIQTMGNSGGAVIGLGYGANVTGSELPAFKQWLAEQYAAGTPVIVVYPLETETTENVTTQTLNTAPVRQTAGSILGMPIEVVLGDGTREWVSEIITIATTKYNEQQFAPVQSELSNAMNVVDDVVTRTMSQAQQIDQIANEKQTRPDESCPPFKKCLLVEGEDGTPHWYEIYDPINDFLNPILAAAALSGNQGAPILTTHSENGSTIYDTANIFFNGSGVFRKKYIDSSQSVSDRPFGPATGPDELPRCTDNATRTTSVKEAGICYDTGGMFRELTEGADDDAGEWAIVYNGNESGASLGITPGVVYGIAKCTSVGQHTTEITGDVVDGSNYWWPEKLMGYTGGGTTLASLITEYPNSNIETVFNTLPNPVGTDDNPEYPRANYRNCWCKMTAIGVPGSGSDRNQEYANGSIMSVSGDWVFDVAFTVAGSCADRCAHYCGLYIQSKNKLREKVLTVR